MHIMAARFPLTRSIAPLLGLLVLLGGCGAVEGNGAPEQDIRFTGRVVYIDLEGGFWGLVAEDGSRYDPGGLPEAYRVDGMAVRARVRPQPDQVSFHMWGTLVELLEIEALSSAP